MDFSSACRVLGLSDEINQLSLVLIKKAFRNMARKHHPDKQRHLPPEEANAVFQGIAQAYEIVLRRLESRDSNSREENDTSRDDYDSDEDDEMFHSELIQIHGGQALSDIFRDEMEKWKLEYARLIPRTKGSAPTWKIFENSVQESWRNLSAERYGASAAQKLPKFGLNPPSLKCSQCGECFVRKIQLDSHIQTKHDPLETFLKQRISINAPIGLTALLSRSLPDGWGEELVTPESFLKASASDELLRFLNSLRLWNKTSPSVIQDKSTDMKQLISIAQEIIQIITTSDFFPRIDPQAASRPMPSPNWKQWYQQSKIDSIREHWETPSENLPPFLPVILERCLGSTPLKCVLPFDLPTIAVRPKLSWSNFHLPCRRCGTIFYSPHHCRGCAIPICSSCSGLSQPYLSRGYVEPVRLCQSCSDETITSEASAWLTSLSVSTQTSVFEGVNIIASIFEDAISPNEWRNLSQAALDPATRFLAGLKGETPLSSQDQWNNIHAIWTKQGWDALCYIYKITSPSINDRQWLQFFTSRSDVIIEELIAHIHLLMITRPGLQKWTSFAGHLEFIKSPKNLALLLSLFLRLNPRMNVQSILSMKGVKDDFNLISLVMLCANGFNRLAPEVFFDYLVIAASKRYFNNWEKISSLCGLGDPTSTLERFAASTIIKDPVVAAWAQIKLSRNWPPDLVLKKCVNLISSENIACAKVLANEFGKTLAKLKPTSPQFSFVEILMHRYISCVSQPYIWRQLADFSLDVDNQPGIAVILSCFGDESDRHYVFERLHSMYQKKSLNHAFYVSLHELVLDILCKCLSSNSTGKLQLPQKSLLLIAQELSELNKQELSLKAFQLLENQGAPISAQDQSRVNSMRSIVQKELESQSRSEGTNNILINLYRFRNYDDLVSQLIHSTVGDATIVEAFVQYISNPAFVATGPGYRQETAIKELSIGVLYCLHGERTETIALHLGPATMGSFHSSVGEVLSLKFNGELTPASISSIFEPPTIIPVTGEGSERVKRLQRNIRAFFRAESSLLRISRSSLETAYHLLDLGAVVGHAPASAAFFLQSAHSITRSISEARTADNFALKKLLFQILCLTFQRSRHSSPGMRTYITKNSMRLIIECHRRCPYFLDQTMMEEHLTLVKALIATYMQVSDVLGSTLWPSDIISATDIVFENYTEAQSFALAHRLENLMAQLESQNKHVIHQNILHSAASCVYYLHEGRYHGWLRLPKDSEDALAEVLTKLPLNGADLGERIDRAEAAKQRGREALERGALAAASAHYSYALGCILDQTQQSSSPQEIIQLKEITLTCRLNLSFLALKLGNWEVAFLHAEEALKLEPTSIKALFRRGIASYELGNRKSAIIDLEASYNRSNLDSSILEKLQEARAGVSHLAFATIDIGGINSPLQFRILCMDLLLKEHSITWSNVAANVVWPCSGRDSHDLDGFISSKYSPLLVPNTTREMEFASIHGCIFSLQDGSSSLLTANISSRKRGMFCQQDIAEILGNSIDQSVFSLEAVDERSAHPFQSMMFSPNRLAPGGNQTLLLRTLFRTDYLLKMISTDVEVSSLPPFPIRRLADGVLCRLPTSLRHEITRLHCETRSSKDSEAHRFWIEAGEMEYSKQTLDDGSVKYIFGHLPMKVKTHKLVIEQHSGKHRDADEDDESSWENRMSELLTTRYDELAGAFPEFDRLRELAKLQVVFRLVKAHVQGTKEHLSSKEALESFKTSIVEMATQIRTNSKSNIDQAFSLFKSNYAQITNSLESIRSQERAAMEEISREKSRIGWSYANSSELQANLSSMERDIKRQADTAYQSQSKVLYELMSQIGLSGKYANDTEIRNSVMREILNNQTEHLVSEFGVQESQCSQALNELVSRSNISPLVDLISRQLQRKQVEKFEKTLAVLRQNGFGDFNLSSDGGLSSGSLACHWIPAAYRVDTNFHVYGGVNLTAQLREARTILQPPPNSVYRLSGTTLGTQRALCIPNSDASRIDNAARAVNAAFQNQAIANQNAFNQAVMNRNHIQQQLSQRQQNSGGSGGSSGSGGGGSGGGSPPGGYRSLLQTENPVNIRVYRGLNENTSKSPVVTVGNVTIYDNASKCKAFDTYHTAGATMINQVLDKGKENVSERRELGDPRGGYRQIELPGDVNGARGTFEVGINLNTRQVHHAVFKRT